MSLLQITMKIYDSGEPNRDETPDQSLRRIHEGEERALRLLDQYSPEPSPEFDERFLDRLAAIQIIERAERTESVEPEFEPSLRALLDADQPEPSADFDLRFRFHLRQVEGEDFALRVPSVDFRVPALPKHASPIIDAALASKPFTPGRFWRIGGLAAAALLVTAIFSFRAAVLDPPDEDVAMVAQLELLENYGPVEAYEGLQDDDAFEVVAALDTFSAADLTDPTDDAEDPKNGEKMQ